MLTRAGVGTAVMAAGLFVAGRLLGAFELFLLGTGAAAILGAGAVSTALTRTRIQPLRTVVPDRVHRGAPARVELQITNGSTRRSPNVRLRDAVSGTRGATVLVAPLAPGETARVAYQLPTDRRGLRTVGPLQVDVGDPFGLTRRRRTGLGATSLLVYPRVDEVRPPAHRPGTDPQTVTRRPRSAGRTGEDFSSLRAYVVGDDPRRVHWPSVARTGELMVRQVEQPHDERTTVVLDVGAGGWWPEGFERAVSATASILAAAARRGDEICLVTTDRPEAQPGTGPAHLESVLRRLALAEPADASSGMSVAGVVPRPARGGSLVVVAPSTRLEELTAVVPAPYRFGSVQVVAVDGPPADADPPTGPAPGGAPVVFGTILRYGPDDDFATVWDRAVGTGPRSAYPADPPSGPLPDPRPGLRSDASSGTRPGDGDGPAAPAGPGRSGAVWP